MNPNDYKDLFTKEICEIHVGKNFDFWSYYLYNCDASLQKLVDNIGGPHRTGLILWIAKAGIIKKVFENWDEEVPNTDEIPKIEELQIHEDNKMDTD